MSPSRKAGRGGPLEFHPSGPAKKRSEYLNFKGERKTGIASSGTVVQTLHSSSFTGGKAANQGGLQNQQRLNALVQKMALVNRGPGPKSYMTKQ